MFRIKYLIYCILSFYFSSSIALRMSGLVDTGISNGFSLDSRVTQLEVDVQTLPIAELTQVCNDITSLKVKLGTIETIVDNLTIGLNGLMSVMETQQETITAQALAIDELIKATSVLDTIDIVSLEERVRNVEKYTVSSFSSSTNLHDPPIIPVIKVGTAYPLWIEAYESANGLRSRWRYGRRPINANEEDLPA